MAEENVHKQTSDDILLSLARSGDLDAIDALIDRYYNICFRTCMTILRDQDHASDACQNCFLKIVKNITSKGFVRSNYEEKLVDLSDVRINLKSKSLSL